MADTLRSTLAGGVLTCVIDRPERRNALDRPLVASLSAQLRRAGSDPAIRCVVLTGSGGAFCSGADLKDFAASTDLPAEFDVRMAEFHAVIRLVTGTLKPIIAAVDGGAVGFGCDLALACDLRVVSTRGYFQEKFATVGLMPDGGGTFLLPRLIGLGRAFEKLLTASPIDATEAERLGLANRIAAPDELLATAQALGEQLASGPPVAFAQIKKAVYAGLSVGLDEALCLERDGQRICVSSNDAREGIAAFIAKRSPVFRGD